ncbi:Flavin carrier protein 2 [Fulvia fulva]|uniref:Flavin carrier protein 2 n=1 Tax=Passalora fulva TaxID=5499 RepID=A0A9Q8PCF8_PASFU|nr:Flavin carrier protein 2 [Fulvia fulva]KAK4620176.1 Flavin carrier protein 2 [Fulvia fulva]KAK4620299.1 Flavin carrier protein 2 [Fulvia fulva]UJO19924.1 Flavin carrier protein 2 [Fulvia fulva]WPV16903.1 Flavin carrier protein 2 [Fulvia fulva]WPV32287.1 Flavin carrier protein 2 [Fulvia fulva]
MAPTWRALLTLGTLLGASSIAHAEDYLRTTSFTNCESSNQFNASTFNITITPENRTIVFDLGGDITFTGNASLDFSIIINGNEAQLFRQDGCIADYPAFCPTTPGQINLNSNIELSETASDMIPEELYTMPDLDAQFKLSFNDTATGQPWGCIEANLTNGVTEASAMNNASSTSDTSRTTNATNGTTTPEGSESSATMTSIFSTLAVGVPAIIAMTLCL